MTIRKAIELTPTLKVSATSDDDMVYAEDIEAVILSIRDLATKHGNRVIASFEGAIQGMPTKFDVFVNNLSMKNLNKAFGEDDTNWVGKNVRVTKKTNEKFGKDMLVIEAVE